MDELKVYEDLKKYFTDKYGVEPSFALFLDLPDSDCSTWVSNLRPVELRQLFARSFVDVFESCRKSDAHNTQN